MIQQILVPTNACDAAPEDLEALLVPGGFSVHNLEATKPVVDFIQERYPKLRFLLIVCPGSALAARAGVLNRRQPTSNTILLEYVSLGWILKTTFPILETCNVKVYFI